MTILTVTLNAAIDKRYDLDEIVVGRVQRVRQVRASAGGKGLNASRGARLCGQRVIATGFLAGFAGQFVAAQLAADEIESEFLQIAGETRTCINVIDAQGNSTELLEPGVPVTSDDLLALRAQLERLLPEVDVVAISGSAPAGCPDGVYVPLIAAARAAGRPVVLDTSGALLRAGLAAGPTVVKPNAEELAALVGRDLAGLDSIVDAARSLLASPQAPGPDWVVVSLGSRGAVAVGAERAVRIGAPKVDAVNPVGCGDVLVGGLASGLARGLDVPAALALGVRVSAASAAHPETGRFDPALAERLAGQVQADEL